MPCVDAVRAGRYQEARRICQQAADEYATSQNFRGQSNAVNMTGTALLRLGDHTGARQHYVNSIALAKKAGDDQAVALRLNNVAGVDYFQGHYEDAERNYRAAADWVAARPSAPWAAKAALTTAVNQATLLQRLGRDRAALDLYLKLQPQAKQLPAEDEGRMLANIGALYRSLGDPVKARELYAVALQRFRAAGSAHGLSGVWKNLGIAEAVEFQDYPAARRHFEQVSTMARSSGDRRDELLAELYLAEVAFRERNIEEAERRWRASAKSAAAMGAAEEEWRALFGLGRVAEARGGSGEEWHGRSMARIEGIRQQTAGGVARAEFLASKRDVYDARIRGLLKRGEVTDDLLDVLERSRARSIADRQFRMKRAGVQKQLRPGEVLVIYWVIKQEKAAVWLTADAAGVTRLAQGWLDGVPRGQRLILVPDGGIEAQPIERGADAEIVFLPALRLLGDPPKDRRNRTSLLVAGPRLANAEQEIREVAGLLPADWNSQANRSAVLKAMPAAHVIHIAAHAFPDFEREERSRLLLRDGSLLLSDVVKAKLQSELVTVAACQSAVGRTVRGEGVQSLASAFLAAGARSVLASRQPVDDAATRAFMTQFYAALARGETKAGALASAKRRLRESRGPMAKPEYWEPWILFGDGRETLAASRPSWSWIPWIGAAVAALTALAVRTRRPAA